MTLTVNQQCCQYYKKEDRKLSYSPTIHIIKDTHHKNLIYKKIRYKSRQGIATLKPSFKPLRHKEETDKSQKQTIIYANSTHNRSGKSWKCI